MKSARQVVLMFSIVLSIGLVNTGCTAEDGRDGIDGIDGKDGLDGQDGADGKDGVDGNDGIDGQDGADGKDGEDGIDGQDGADGIDGQDGADGEAGPRGPKGEDGGGGNAANAIVSDWIPADFATEETSFTFFDVADSRISQQIFDTATVLYFGKVVDGEFVGLITLPAFYGNKSYYAGLLPKEKVIRFIGNLLNGGGDGETFDDFTEVRYVIIPSGTTSKNTNNYSKMSYKEVMDSLGLAY